MFYTVYKTTNSITNEYYIGSHITENPNDSYLGSGKLLNERIKQLGREHFSKTILAFCDDKKQMARKEKQLVVRRDKDPLSLNLVDGGGIPPVIKRFGEDNVFKRPDVRQKLKDNHVDVSGANNPNYGKHHSIETKLKIAQSKIGMVASWKGKPKPRCCCIVCQKEVSSSNLMKYHKHDEKIL